MSVHRFLLFVVLAACTSDRVHPTSPDAAGGDHTGDAGDDDTSDATIDDADQTPTPDAASTFEWPTCGTMAFPQGELYYGHAIAVADDGTVYHAHYDAAEMFLSRYRPGQPAERRWAHVGPGSTTIGALAVDPAGTPYAHLRTSDDRTHLVRIENGAVVAIGVPVPSISGPTGLAFSPDGILFESSFTGLSRVDVATGQRTPVSPPVQLREVYFVGPRVARGVSYDHGLVEITLDASATSSTFTTIFPFTTLALQFTGMDQLGRTYALVHEMSTDKLVRFDPTFASRETLVSYPSVPIVFGRLAFGRGALRCDVLVTGFNIGRVASNDTPGVP